MKAEDERDSIQQEMNKFKVVSDQYEEVLRLMMIKNCQHGRD